MGPSPAQSDRRVLEKALARVERRMRLVRLIDLGTTVLVILLLATAVALLLHKMGLFPAQAWPKLAFAGASLGLAALLSALLLPVDRAHAAKRLDLTFDLSDRCTCAYAFLAGGQAELDPFARAAVADAAAHVSRVRPSRAMPLRSPTDLRLLGLLVVVVVMVGLVKMPAPEPDLPRRAPRVARLALATPDLEERKEELRDLVKDADETKDPALKDFAREMKKLLDALEQRTLTRKEAFEKIAKLENKYFRGLDGDFAELKGRIARLGGQLSKEKLTEELGKSLEQGRLDQARKAMEKLQERLEKQTLTPKERKRLAKVLERAAQHERQDETKRDELHRELKRLEREQEKQPTAERKKELERKKRELKRLERDLEERQSKAERQLKRLQRELQEAAEELMKQLDPKTAEALRKAMEELSKLQNEVRRVGGMQRGQGQLADLKELLRRLKAGGKIRIGQLDDFMRRARGPKGQNGQGKDGQGNPSNDITLGLDPSGGGLPLPLGGRRPGSAVGRPQSSNQPGGGQQPSGGQQYGTGHVPTVPFGNPTQIQARHTEQRLDGVQGKGPSRSEVILGASEKGFATRAYRRVYRDYTGVVEEVLNKEKVPLGYKFYVKKYFTLIKPRE